VARGVHSRAKRALVPGVVLAASFALMADARAGYEGSVWLGGDAGLMGGAGLTVVGQANGVWYNPAGLGKLDTISLDVSASMYSATYRSLQGVAVTTLPWGTLRSSGSATAFTSVPSTVATSYQLTPRLGLGLGVFVPSRQDFTFSSNEASSGLVGDRPTSYGQDFFMHSSSERTYFGAALGAHLGQRLRLGLALFAVRDDSDLNFQLALALHEPSDPMAQQGAFAIFSVHEGHQVFGGRASSGVQLELGDGWSLGALLWTPVLRMYERATSTTIMGLTTRLPGAPSEQSLEVTTVAPRPLLAFAPWRAAGGLAFSPPSWHLAAEIDYRPGGRHGFDERFQSVWNARLGMLRALTSDYWLGAGVFSDRSDRPRGEGEGSDYYGVTTGLKYRPTRLRERRDRSWDIAGTVGLRYTYGEGQLRIFSLSADPASTAPGQPINGRLKEHEVQLQLGTSLAY
jgi:hypothetical protein